MFICNITFICSQDDLQSRISHLKEVLIPSLNIPPVSNVALMIVSNVLGDPDFASNDRSLPLQVSFRSAQERDAWMEMILFPALEQYSRTFGEKGLLMVSTLDTIPTTDD